MGGLGGLAELATLLVAVLVQGGWSQEACSSGVCYSLGVQGCSCAVAGACGADVLMASCSSKVPCEYYLASLNHVPALVVVWRMEGGWV